MYIIREPFVTTHNTGVTLKIRIRHKTPFLTKSLGFPDNREGECPWSDHLENILPKSKPCFCCLCRVFLFGMKLARKSVSFVACFIVYPLGGTGNKMCGRSLFMQEFSLWKIGTELDTRYTPV